jgi:hypothetical protein
LSGQVANSSFSAHRSTLAGSAGWISRLIKIVGKRSSDSKWEKPKMFPLLLQHSLMPIVPWKRHRNRRANVNMGPY